MFDEDNFQTNRFGIILRGSQLFYVKIIFKDNNRLLQLLV